MKHRRHISIAVVLALLVLLWLSSASAKEQKKKATADVSIGEDYDVTFQPESGEWNPFYVKRSSVDLEEN